MNWIIKSKINRVKKKKRKENNYPNYSVWGIKMNRVVGDNNSSSSNRSCNGNSSKILYNLIKLLEKSKKQI